MHCIAEWAEEEVKALKKKQTLFKERNYNTTHKEIIFRLWVAMKISGSLGIYWNAPV